jgi:hypothetical protein
MAETTLPPEPENLILAQLRAIRGTLDDHSRRFDEVIDRLARVERELVATRRDITNLHEDWAGMAVRLDNLDRRVGRIERRLELADGEVQQ